MPLTPDRVVLRSQAFYSNMKGAEAEARDHPEHSGWRLLILLVMVATLAAIAACAYLA